MTEFSFQSKWLHLCFIKWNAAAVVIKANHAGRGLWFRYNSMRAVWHAKEYTFQHFGVNSLQTADTARVVPGRFQFQMHSPSSGALLSRPHVEPALLQTSCRETPKGVCVCARITPYHQLNRTVFSKNQLLITRGTSQGPASHVLSLSLRHVLFGSFIPLSFTPSPFRIVYASLPLSTLPSRRAQAFLR